MSKGIRHFFIQKEWCPLPILKTIQPSNSSLPIIPVLISSGVDRYSAGNNLPLMCTISITIWNFNIFFLYFI